MQIPHYLLLNSYGIFTFRIAVPGFLRNTIQQREIKRSLRTTNRTEAVRLARRLAVQCQIMFEKTAMGYDPFLLMKDIKISNMSVDLGNGQKLRCRNVELDPETDDAKQFTQMIQELKSGNSTVANSKPFTEVLELFLTERKAKGNPPERIEALRKYFNRFITILGDKQLDSYDIEDAQTYRKILQSLPSKPQKKQYRGKTVFEMSKMEHDSTMSAKTVNNRINDVSGLFHWAIPLGYATKNPFQGTQLKIKSRADEQRNMLSDADVLTIFANLQQDVNKPSVFWVPILAAFTGMRLSELCQLQKRDIVNIDSVLCIQVNDDGDRSVKTENGIRTVPIHSQILKLGFENLVNNADGQLFPECKKVQGKYGHYFSKWFGTFRKRIGVDGDGQTFHGFRHSVITKFRDNEILETFVAEIVGHESGETMSYKRYAKKGQLTPLINAIEKVSYGELVNVELWPG